MPLMCSMKAVRRAFVSLKWSEITLAFLQSRWQGTVLQPHWEHQTMRRTLNKTFLTHLTRIPVAASAAWRVDTSAAGARATRSCVSYFVV